MQGKGAHSTARWGVVSPQRCRSDTSTSHSWAFQPLCKQSCR